MKNKFKILLTTDNHLGYLEKDLVRGQDSFNTFEEILQISASQNVDFILLGGDLFHDSNPSKQTYFRLLTLLRKYCFGSRPVAFDCVSENDNLFDFNYLDPNLNISMPIFGIHGNHDEIGSGNLCCMELLDRAGFVNYFGKQSAVDDLHIKPLLFRKGSCKLALYV